MFKLWICICARGFGPPWTIAEELKLEAVCSNYAWVLHCLETVQGLPGRGESEQNLRGRPICVGTYWPHPAPGRAVPFEAQEPEDWSRRGSEAPATLYQCQPSLPPDGLLP